MHYSHRESFQEKKLKSNFQFLKAFSVVNDPICFNKFYLIMKHFSKKIFKVKRLLKNPIYFPLEMLKLFSLGDL